MELRRQLEGEKRGKLRATEQLQQLRSKYDSLQRGLMGGNSIATSRFGSNKSGAPSSHRGSILDANGEDSLFMLSPDSSREKDAYSDILTIKDTEERNWTTQALECGSKLRDLEYDHNELLRSIENRNNVKAFVCVAV